MVQTIQAKNVTLRTLIDDFGFQLVRDDQFFREWQENLPEITAEEKQYLDRIVEGFFNLLDYPPLLEGVIRMSIVDPLLFLGSYPFHPDLMDLMYHRWGSSPSCQRTRCYKPYQTNQMT